MKHFLAIMCAVCFASVPAQANETALANIRSIATTLSPQISSEKSQIQIAIQLRDQIHRTGILSGSGLPALSTSDLAKWDDAYRKSFLSRTRANSCNGLSILYMLALRSFGIKSRMVAMYADTTASLQMASHASVDVLIDGKWIAMDPTFNLSLNNDLHQNISWREAVERYRSGKLVLQAMDGMTRLKTNPFNYFETIMQSSFKSVSAYVLLGPYASGNAESMNQTWDGKLNYIDGRQFDAWASINSDFYRNIAGQK